MIKHVLRAERIGGYWLVRDHGRAIELTNAEYRLMSRLHATAGKLEECERRRLTASARVSDSQMLIDELSVYGLDDPGRPQLWHNVRHVPLDRAPELLPTDAAVAPKRIYFEITRGCNLRCRSCFNNSGPRLPDELTLEEVFEIHRQAYELGVFEIRYTGGECTTVPGFADMVADARKRGFYVSIGTNGVYTDEQLEWLPNCGVDWFIVSLDGDRATNDRVRGKGTYDHVLHSLKHLSQNADIRIRLNMVVAKHNVTTIEQVARVATMFHVTSLNLIPLRPYGRSTTHLTDDMFTQRDFYAFIREVNQLRRAFPEVTFSTSLDLLDPEATTSHDLIVRKEKTCAAGVEACVIGPQGHVYGCSYSPASFPDSADEEDKRVFLAGNIREDNLRTIWRDSTRWAVFRNLSQYKNPKCRTCSHYMVRCCGSCQIMAWYQLKHGNNRAANQQRIGKLFDPYCFVDLLDEQCETDDVSSRFHGRKTGTI